MAQCRLGTLARRVQTGRSAHPTKKECLTALPLSSLSLDSPGGRVEKIFFHADVIIIIFISPPYSSHPFYKLHDRHGKASIGGTLGA